MKISRCVVSVTIAIILALTVPANIFSTAAAVEEMTLLTASAKGREDAPVLTARSAILIEASTGRVIYEQAADERRYPASTTKIMTALLGLENLSPREEVFYTPDAALTEETPLGIAAGERLSAEEIITGMLLESDNGAAVAIAEAVDGSVRDFAARMNRHAAAIGMKNTHFMNPNGLPDTEHYSTARDLALLSRAAMENSDFRAMVGQAKHYLKWSYPEKFSIIENTNKLLTSYDGMTGIKTGWTTAAGGCLAASAKRGGVELIAVVLGTPGPDDRFDDAERLLDYGFARVRMVRGINKDRIEKSVWVKGATQARVKLHPVSDINYPLVDGEDASHYRLTYDTPKVVAAPLKEGEIVGSIVINYDGKPVGTIALAAEKVDAGFSLGSWLVGLFEGLLVRI